MSITVLYDDFLGSSTLAAPWTNVSRTWASYGYDFNAGTPYPPTNVVVGAAMLGNTFATGLQGTTPAVMGKTILATNWFAQISGDASNDKVAEVSASLVWRQQTDQFTYTVSGAPTTVANHTTYLGLIIAGTSTGVGAYAVLVTRTGGASPSTTGRLVRVDTSSSFATPTFTDIGGAAVTLPNASNGDRWTLKARLSWFAPSFSIASILATFVDANGVSYSVGLPTGQFAGTYGLNTGQGTLATWSAGELYVGFLNRPGWRVVSPSIGAGSASPPILAPNQFERLRVRDVGALANLTTSTPAYTYSTPIVYTAASVSSESNASAYSLAVQPSWSQQTVDDWQASTFYSDSGDRVAFPLQTKRRRRWSFRWTALDDSEKATLATLNSNVKGRFSTWSWTDPETALAVSVRFVSDIGFQKIGPSAWSASANVEEVL